MTLTEGGRLVYPARFEYLVTTTLDEALSILDRDGDEAKVLAGGQSLIPLKKLRFAAPRTLVSLGLAAFGRAIARFFRRIVKRSERGRH